MHHFSFVKLLNHEIGVEHGLRTPNEGINQRYLKNWADVADNSDRPGVTMHPAQPDK